MQRILSLVVFCLAWTSVLTWADGGDLEKAIDQAIEILDRYANEKEDTVPAEAFQKCKGLAIMHVMKAGFIFSGSGGTGLVVMRTKNGKWSPPSAISAGGIGIGLQAGGSSVDYVMLLNTDDAVKEFSKQGNYKGGVEAEGTAGSEGRNLSAGLAGMSAITTYSFSQGLFGGVSTSDMGFGVEDDTNQEFYGESLKARDILAGKNKQTPAAVKRLWKALDEADRKTKITYENNQKNSSSKK
ncbi:hypothetical protein EBX31_14685 [bacterium]|nr:hypothetical protein [bacterium]